jgi:hypothetical protein
VTGWRSIQNLQQGTFEEEVECARTRMWANFGKDLSILLGFSLQCPALLYNNLVDTFDDSSILPKYHRDINSDCIWYHSYRRYLKPFVIIHRRLCCSIDISLFAQSRERRGILVLLFIQILFRLRFYCSSNLVLMHKFILL